jgi:hypothetical protein
MNLAPWQYTLWLVGLMVITFASGCSIGLTFARKQKAKTSNARKR